MKPYISLITLIVFLLTSCSSATPMSTPTDFPTETSTPTNLPTATSSPIPILTATTEPDKFVANVESLTCATKEDCLNGKYEIGPGATDFYNEVIASLLEGGWLTRPENYIIARDSQKFVDNEEFQQFIKDNFGVDSTDADTFIAALRERDYKVPEGMPIPQRDTKSAEHVRVQPAPAFSFDTIAIELLDSETFIERTYSKYPDEPEIKSRYLIKGVILQKSENYVWGLRFKEFPDGETRMVLTVATSTNLPWEEAGVVSSNSKANQYWENWLKFFPYLFANAGHSVDDMKGGTLISVRGMLNPDLNNYDLWTGEYDRTASSNSNVLIPSSK